MRNVGAARRGLNLWLVQRASAVLMVLAMLGFVLFACPGGTLDYAGWQAVFQPMAVKVLVLLFVASLLAHAWVREVMIDYVHPLKLRLPLYFLFATLYLACLVWAADILWSVK